MYTLLYIIRTLRVTWLICCLWREFFPMYNTHCNTHYNTAHTATHCNTLQHTRQLATIHCNTHCNALQRTATHYNKHCNTLQHTATYCNLLQHTATHCNTLQHTATNVCTCAAKTAQSISRQGCNTLQHTATHCNTLQHTATHVCTWAAKTAQSMSRQGCNILQHTATHCNTLQHMCVPGRQRQHSQYLGRAATKPLTRGTPLLWGCRFSTWNMTHSDVRHDSFTCMTWLTYDVPWIINHRCVVSLWNTSLKPFMGATWLVHVCDMTHSCGFDMIRSHLWRDSYIMHHDMTHI